MKKQKTIQTALYCSECDTKMPIVRKASRRKSKGHLKHMYCPTCKIVTEFREQEVEDKSVSFWTTYQEECVDKYNIV